MGPDKQKVAGIATIKRLPAYLHLLRHLSECGRQVVSSDHIAGILKADAIQIRKDLAVTGCEGKPRVGYYIPALIKAIEEFLGWDNTTEAFLVGAGNLGSALLGYKGFERSGLDIIAAFDADESKVGQEIHGKQVLHMNKLSDMVKRMHIRIGVITVPSEAAQEVADVMVEAGIEAIWNFTPVSLDHPKNVIVQNEDLSSGLAVLSVRLSQADEAREFNEAGIRQEVSKV